MQPDEPIAIVGIGGLFPGAETLEQFWANVRDGVDSTSEVPPDRWLIEPERAYDPRVAVADHVYSIRGGYIASPTVDARGLNIDPALLKRLDPVFHLALRVAREAWSDAQTEDLDLSRVGVIFGNIVLPTETASALTREVLGAALAAALGVPGPQPESIEPMNAFPAGLPAAIVARALGLGGPAFTIDAACGSSLYALKLAVDELRTRRADAILCGGVSRPDPLYTQMGFSQLRALSARGTPAPLDHRGDGLVVGEGAGMFVLKRLIDALAHGDHIYGVIAGIGLSNDVHGDLLAPSSEGQLRAMRMAYGQAGWAPGDVDLVECHAAGTPVGDAVEVESLKSLWSEIPWNNQQCVIGSVKSNIGHALTAAGAAGLLKVLLAIKNKTLPPTANFERSAPRLELDEGPFRVLSHAQVWPRREAAQPLRAAISGFGFGGINCHVLIEEWTPKPKPKSPAGWSSADRSQPIAIVGLSAHFGPFAERDSFATQLLGTDEKVNPSALKNGWGVADSPSSSSLTQDHQTFPGYYVESLEFDIDQFRIPPKELAEMLPQQSLMLRTAAQAIADARLNAETALRTGVLIGIGLDPSATNYHLRWSMADRGRTWNQVEGLGLSHDELTHWVDDLRRSAGPPLTANRTMGSLGGLIASRIAREFKIGGRSFTISCDETSGIQALAIAVDWLRRGELDTAIVGAVDFAGDVRSVIARHQLSGAGSDGSCACDGAVALVLKRLDDAQRDGDHVHAIVEEVDPASNIDRERTAITAASTQEIGSIEIDLGNAGAATGLGTVAKAALCLNRRIVPPHGRESGPSYWMRNREDGPRCARVNVANLGGAHGQVILKECEDQPTAARPSSLLRINGPALFAIEADNPADLAIRIDELSELARDSSPGDMVALARRWWHRHPNNPGLRLGMAMVADQVDALRKMLNIARQRVHDRVVTAPVTPNRLAFVYPGLGNQFAGMGRALSALWPDILDAQDAENGYLRDQFDPSIWWNDELPRVFADHREPILGSVSLSAIMTDVLRSLGVVPDASIGYSLGESAALIALRAWTGRDEMLRRLRSSPLFQTELAGPCDVARRVWGIPPTVPVEWVAGIVPRSAEVVRAAIGGRTKIYILIKNTAEETVIGGDRRTVDAVIHELRCQFIALSTVSTVHCELGREVAAEYHALHDLETNAPPGIDFYSGAWGRTYVLDRRSAADAITGQAIETIDFPALVERAYSDGIRIFLEVGPGASCTRMIGQILRGRPHAACAACRPDRTPLVSILEVLAELITHRAPVNLSKLFGDPVSHESEAIDETVVADGARRRKIRVDVRASSFKVSALPASRKTLPRETDRSLAWKPASEHLEPIVPARAPVPPVADESTSRRMSLVRSVHDAEKATAEAHQAFLRVAHGATDLIGKHLAFQLVWIEGVRNGTATTLGHTAEPPPEPTPIPGPDAEPVWLDRPSCLEFAIGSIGNVLGPEFASIDRFPTRVRLPDEPLMLVDRILSVEGEPRSLQNGRVVTEHIIEPNAWYLDAGRIAPCIAIEAGQADLFLSAYLGVDFETQGLAVYRLLDATVTFHRGLPAAGDVIRYDIHITNFFRQGKTILFRFHFNATVAGEPLLTMRDGCAGFFTQEELAAGRGIVPPSLEIPRNPGAETAIAPDLISIKPTRLDQDQINALRRGDLATAFGPPFDRARLVNPLALPSGRMNLIHRVSALDPAGGSFGLGLLRAEADIRPGDWFMVCHFVDDRVMPGTLMYECCLHALRIFMMRAGWIGARGEVAFEPVPGIANRLKCRGQILESSRLVTYEISIKERGYRPEPYAIADALILADGKPIVEVSNMALQLSGTSRTELERLWGEASLTEPREGEAPARQAPLYDYDRIHAFAVGRPSAAFGERYRVFDSERFIARLPGPPYQFLDRITQVEGAPWVMAAGCSAEAEFDVRSDAWYFSADRQVRMPFAVLLEVPLQVCGWLAAYMGSALTSDDDLKFRNLGGTARQHRPVTRQTGTLTSRIRVTKISSSAGMIIQQYEFEVHDRDGLVYDGSTDFGFFHPRALAQQVGIRDGAPYALCDREQASARPFDFPDDAPFPDSTWRMIDRVDALILDGGPHGLGVVQGSSRVDPDAWFFKAHFLGDPVWPGSLGVEAFLQLLKVMAVNRWGASPSSVFESPGIEQTHRWIYRGQIIPANQRVTVQAEITACDDRARLLTADGYLAADGKVIYRLNDFSIRMTGA